MVRRADSALMISSGVELCVILSYVSSRCSLISDAILVAMPILICRC